MLYFCGRNIISRCRTMNNICQKPKVYKSRIRLIVNTYYHLSYPFIAPVSMNMSNLSRDLNWAVINCTHQKKKNSYLLQLDTKIHSIKNHINLHSLDSTNSNTNVSFLNHSNIICIINYANVVFPVPSSTNFFTLFQKKKKRNINKQKLEAKGIHGQIREGWKYQSKRVISDR